MKEMTALQKAIEDGNRAVKVAEDFENKGMVLNLTTLNSVFANFLSAGIEMSARDQEELINAALWNSTNLPQAA